MRLRIDTSEVRFRVASAVKPRQKSRTDPAQKLTPDGRPIWVVRLDAIETGREAKETIWVEVAGDEPKLTFDEFATVHGLAFAPWVGRDGQIVRQFRADDVTAEGQGRRAA